MRRAQADANHAAPYLDDLLNAASGPVGSLEELSLPWIVLRSRAQSAALNELWSIFGDLSLTERASCVGISKAVLLATNGRIEPALDSQVRGRLGIAAPTTAIQWIGVLEDVASDIVAFEKRHGPLQKLAPEHLRHLDYGRLYDMVFGPQDAPGSRSRKRCARV